MGRLFGLRHDPRAHVVVLEPEQVAQVLAAAQKWYPDHALLVTVLFLTACGRVRRSGCSGRTSTPARNLIDLQRTVAVRGGRAIVNTPKSGRLRIVDCPLR